VKIQSAAEKLITTGAIHRHNLYEQSNVLEQLARDPTSIPLALRKRSPGQERQVLSNDFSEPYS